MKKGEMNIMIDEINSILVKLPENRQKQVLEYVNFIYQQANKDNRATDIDSKSINKLDYTFANDNLSYLDGLTPGTRNWVCEILKNENINMYHSATSIIQGSHGHTLNEKIKYYLDKYQTKRSYLKGQEDKINELFNYAFIRLKKKGALK